MEPLNIVFIALAVAFIGFIIMGFAIAIAIIAKIFKCMDDEYIKNKLNKR